jgi:hypothetical protein
MARIHPCAGCGEVSTLVVGFDLTMCLACGRFTDGKGHLVDAEKRSVHGKADGSRP